MDNKDQVRLILYCGILVLEKQLIVVRSEQQTNL